MILDKDSLLDRLKIAADRITTVKEVNIPALKMFRFFSQGDELFIEASDIEKGMRAIIPNVDDVEPCDFLVDAEKLLKLIKETDANVIHFKLTDKHLEVKCGESSSKFVLNKDIDDFPILPAFLDDEAFEVDDEFVWKLRSVGFDVASEAERVAFTGVNIEVLDSNTLRFSTVDHTRVSINKIKTLTPVNTAFNILVPIKLIEDFCKYKRGGIMKLAYGNNKFMIKVDGIVFYTGIYADKFPDAPKNLKNKADEFVEFDTDAAKKAAKIALIFADTGYARFRTENEEAIIAVETETGGTEARFSVTGNTTAIHGVSIDKLRKMFDLAGRLKLGFNAGDGKKSYWYFMTDDDPDWLSVLMPMS